MGAKADIGDRQARKKKSQFLVVWKTFFLTDFHIGGPRVV